MEAIKEKISKKIEKAGTSGKDICELYSLYLEYWKNNKNFIGDVPYLIQNMEYFTHVKPVYIYGFVWTQTNDIKDHFHANIIIKIEGLNHYDYIEVNHVNKGESIIEVHKQFPFEKVPFRENYYYFGSKANKGVIGGIIAQGKTRPDLSLLEIVYRSLDWWYIHDVVKRTETFPGSCTGLTETMLYYCLDRKVYNKVMGIYGTQKYLTDPEKNMFSNVSITDHGDKKYIISGDEKDIDLFDKYSYSIRMINFEKLQTMFREQFEFLKTGFPDEKEDGIKIVRSERQIKNGITIFVKNGIYTWYKDKKISRDKFRPVEIEGEKDNFKLRWTKENPHFSGLVSFDSNGTYKTNYSEIYKNTIRDLENNIEVHIEPSIVDNIKTKGYIYHLLTDFKIYIPEEINKMSIIEEGMDEGEPTEGSEHMEY